jgi:hypothetical protein
MRPLTLFRSIFLPFSVPLLDFAQFNLLSHPKADFGSKATVPPSESS